MINEKSAGIILFYIKNDEPIFLLLKYPRYWGFSKGLVEKDETEKQAAIRELKEETSIEKFNFLNGFEYGQEWFYRRDGKLVHKKAIFFLAETTEQEARKTKISWEHEDFAWLPLKNAVEKLNLENNKKMLKEAYKFIKEWKKQKTLV